MPVAAMLMRYFRRKYVCSFLHVKKFIVQDKTWDQFQSVRLVIIITNADWNIYFSKNWLQSSQTSGIFLVNPIFEYLKNFQLSDFRLKGIEVYFFFQSLSDFSRIFLKT